MVVFDYFVIIIWYGEFGWDIIVIFNTVAVFLYFSKNERQF